MEESPNFIPLFRTDIVSLEALFLNQCGADALKKVKQQQEKEGIPFDTAFKIFEERLSVRIWHGFEKNKLREDAKNGAWKITSHSKNDSAKRGFNMNISPHPDPDAELLFIPFFIKGTTPSEPPV